MGNNNFSSQLNLFDKSRIKLIISHQENRNILAGFLKNKYKVIISSVFDNISQADIIIIDEQSLVNNRDKIVRQKQSKISLYLPIILITSRAIDDIPDKYLEIIDEIIKIPIKKNILQLRIENFLNIRKLFLSTQIYQKLTDKNPVGVCILYKNRNIKYVNKSFLNILQLRKEDILDKSLIEILPFDTIKNYLNKKNNLEDKIFTLNLDKINMDKWVNIHFSNIRYEHVKLKLLILVDITKQKRAEAKMTYLSFRDQLTGLYNRRYFTNEIERLKQSRKIPISIIAADIDDLKYVNDNYGHKKGDELIQLVAEILEEVLRNEDIIARIGGDEFAVILPETGTETVENICARIKEESQKINNENPELNIEFSLGHATMNDSSGNLNNVFDKADQNMYKNKKNRQRK